MYSEQQGGIPFWAWEKFSILLCDLFSQTHVGMVLTFPFSFDIFDIFQVHACVQSSGGGADRLTRCMHMQGVQSLFSLV